MFLAVLVEGVLHHSLDDVAHVFLIAADDFLHEGHLFLQLAFHAGGLFILLFSTGLLDSGQSILEHALRLAFELAEAVEAGLADAAVLIELGYLHDAELRSRLLGLLFFMAAGKQREHGYERDDGNQNFFHKILQIPAGFQRLL